MEIGLKLRQAMLLNGILYNSEAWHNISESEIKMLEQVDEYLLRTLVKGHSKTPLEFLYLEAGATPIRFIITSRRLMYHHTILKREDTELVKKIYAEQRNNPTKGDYVELIKEDFKTIDVVQNDGEIQNQDKSSYKNFVKKSIKSAAFKYLTQLQASHSKVSKIEYKNLEIQKYMVSPVFLNEEVSMLHALRSRTTECKENFKQKYMHSDLLCLLCQNENEDQQHLLKCSILKTKFKSEQLMVNKVNYENIFSADVNKQKEIAALYLELFKLRNTLIDEIRSQPAPSTTDAVLIASDNLQISIVHSLSGK